MTDKYSNVAKYKSIDILVDIIPHLDYDTKGRIINTYKRILNKALDDMDRYGSKNMQPEFDSVCRYYDYMIKGIVKLNELRVNIIPVKRKKQDIEYYSKKNKNIRKVANKETLELEKQKRINKYLDQKVKERDSVKKIKLRKKD